MHRLFQQSVLVAVRMAVVVSDLTRVNVVMVTSDLTASMVTLTTLLPLLLTFSDVSRSRSLSRLNCVFFFYKCCSFVCLLQHIKPDSKKGK